MQFCFYQADSSTQNHHDYFCQRADCLVLHPEATDVELLHQSPALSFQRMLLPLGVLGYGEGDLAHKMRLVLHAMHLQTGTPEALRKMRWSIRGLCSDQGTERGLCDAPNIIDPEMAIWGLGEHTHRLCTC